MRTADCAMFTAWSPIRSRSLLIRETASTNLRSVAINWCNAKTCTTRSSISICSSLMASSSSSTRLASCSSESSTECTPWCTARSARLPIHSSRSFNSFRSRSKWRSMNRSLQTPELLAQTRLCPSSPKTPGDVSFCPRIPRRGEQLRRRAELDQLPRQQECREVAHPRRLLHVVRHDHERAEVFQLHEQLFNLRCADGVQR